MGTSDEINPLPERLRTPSLSDREPVLPYPEVLEALTLLASNSVGVLGGKARCGIRTDMGITTSIRVSVSSWSRLFPGSAEHDDPNNDPCQVIRFIRIWLKMTGKTEDEVLSFCSGGKLEEFSSILADTVPRRLMEMRRSHS